MKFWWSFQLNGILNPNLPNQVLSLNLLATWKQKWNQANSGFSFGWTCGPCWLQLVSDHPGPAQATTNKRARESLGNGNQTSIDILPHCSKFSPATTKLNQSGQIVPFFLLFLLFFFRIFANLIWTQQQGRHG